MRTDSMARLRRGLQKHFGPGAAVFVDPVLWLAGCVAVDILRLDGWLQKRNPDYRDDESMPLFIRRKYSDKVERFVEYWIKGEPQRECRHVQGRSAPTSRSPETDEGSRSGCRETLS
jgi:hypothetical protein